MPINTFILLSEVRLVEGNEIEFIREGLRYKGFIVKEHFEGYDVYLYQRI